MIGAITAGLLAGGVPPVTNSYESIATVNLSASQTTITFASIPSTYKHLQLRAIARDTGSSADADRQLRINFNDDYGNNYSIHRLSGSGSSTGSDGYSSVGVMAVTGAVGGGAAANIFGGVVIDVLDYASTVKNKTMRSLSGGDLNGSGSIYFSSNAWYSTAAVNKITIVTLGTYEWAANSQFALYGIKG